MSNASSSSASTSKEARNYNKYVSKYILKNSSMSQNTMEDTKSIENNKCTVSQISNSQQITAEDIVKRMTNIVRRYETPDVQYKPKRKILNVDKEEKNTKDGFVSFSQLQSCETNEINKQLFNNSFEIEDSNLNSMGIDSQWNCDTQLAMLVDNADAIVNMFNTSKEMTQNHLLNDCEIYDKNKIKDNESKTITNSDKTNKQMTIIKKNLDHCVNDNYKVDGVCVPKTFSPKQKRDENDSPDVFKVPLSKFKLPKNKCIDFNISSDECSSRLRSKSQIVERSALDIEPLLFSQSYGFKTASQKNIKISDVAYEKAVKIFENIDEIQDIVLPDCFSVIGKNVDRKNLDNSNVTALITSNLPSSNIQDEFKTDEHLNNTINNDDEIFENTVVETNTEIKIVDTSVTKTTDSDVTECVIKESTENSEDMSSQIELTSDNLAESRLNETYIIKETTNAQNKVVALKDFETFFNNTMNSSDISNERSQSQDDSDDNMPSSPILISQKDKVIINKKNRIDLSEPNLNHNSSRGIEIKTIDVASSNCDSLVTIQQLIDDSNRKDLEKPKNVFSSNCVVGFKTANNKPVAVSEEAIIKTKNIFKDIYLNPIDFEEDFEDVDSAVEETSKKHRKTSEDDEIGETDDKYQLTYTKQQPESEVIDNLGFAGFKTANNKDIAISKAAVEKTKKMFEDMDCHLDCYKGVDAIENIQNKKIPMISNANVKVENAQMYSEFITANNKPILFSIQEYENAKAFVNDDAVKTNMVQSNNVINGESSKVATILGTSEKDKVSDVSREKTKSFINNIPAKNETNPTIQLNTGPNDCNLELSVFKTASNKQISISKEALAKVKSVFDNINSEIDSKEESNKNAVVIKPSQTSSTGNDSKILTVKSKEIFVTEDSKDMFGDADIEAEFKSEFAGNELDSNMNGKSAKSIASKPSTFVDFTGFVTASNKNIKVSKEGLLKAKLIFDGLESECDKESIDCKNDGDYINKENSKDKLVASKPSTFVDFSGFITASNKNINISKEGLSKAKLLFNGIESEFNNTFIDPKNNGDDFVENSGGSEELTKSTNLFTASNEDIAKSENSNAKDVNDLQCDIEEVTNEKNPAKEYSIPETISQSFSGFSTSSSKTIQISEQALKKSKSTFEDINSEITNEIANENMKECDKFNKPLPYTNVTSRFPGFATASNKKISISNDALLKAKTLFSDIELQSDKECNEQATKMMDDKEVPNFPGFTTGNNKKITVSDEALAKARNFFSDSDVNEETSSSNLKFFGGFMTANNKEIKISEEALSKAKHLFSDIDVKEETSSPLVNQNIKSFGGFMIVNNKKITISEEALSKTKNVFSDIDVDQGTSTPLINQNIKPFGGFMTANNTKIKISEEALSKPKNLFSDIDQEIDTSEDSENPKIYGGFMTANNKENKISEEALSKVKNVFSDIDVDQGTSSPLINQNPKPFGGFMTANNSKIKISEEALSKAKNLFSDIDVNDESKSPNLKSFGGFMTANNKEIKISEEALSKAKNIFSDIDVKEETSSPLVNQKIKSFEGFMTVNNKKITKSEEALSKTKNIFSDINQEVNTPVDSEIPKPFGGFMTANNKEIKISEEALSKAMLLFDDLDSKLSDAKLLSKDVKESPMEITAVKSKSEIIQTDSIENSRNTNIPDVQCSSKFVGFSTASKKSIPISQKGLAEVRRIFDDIDNELKTEQATSETVQKDLASSFKNISKFVGFSTASKKSIPISEKGLAEARRIFDDVDSETKTNNKQVHNTDVCVNKDENFKAFVGFSTASNNKIAVSDKALKKVQNLFADLDNDNNVIKDNVDVVNKEVEETGNNLSESVTSTSNLKTNKLKCGDEDLKNPTPFVLSLTQEISESKKALLNDEHFFDVKEENIVSNVEDFEGPSSPILPSRAKRSKKAFKAPYKNVKQVEDDDNLAKKRKIEVDVVTRNVTKGEVKVIPEKIPPESVDLGDLYNEKLSRNPNDKISLKHLKPCRNEINSDISNMTPENFEQFVFKNDRNEFEVSNSVVTVKDLIEIFLKSSNVDRKLIPEHWVMNHVKWIMWKLASYERFFANSFHNALTVRSVLEQLKFRYDKELYKAERPLLRKILECDDVPGRKMVLCVSRIIKPSGVVTNGETPQNTMSYELEVTDGWYSVTASIDSLLISAVRSGKLIVGTKIITCGAELHNCGQGKSPLEDISDVRLRLHGNSTRIAPWHYKLGACHNSEGGLLRVGADSLRARAGPVPILRLLPLVVYPQLYVEKLPSGDTVTRSERLEQVYLSSMEGDVQARVEQIYIEAEKEVLGENEMGSKKSGKLRKRKKRDGENLDEEELLEMMEEANDPEEFLASLSATQRECVVNAVSKKQLETRERIDARVKEMMKERGMGITNRKIVSILKVRGLILELKNGVRKVTSVMLTVWKAQETTLDLLNRMQLLNLYWATPTGIRMGELHLSTSKQTIFTEVKNQKYIENYPEVRKYIRNCTPIVDLNHPRFAPNFNEVDTVGLVFKIEPSAMPQSNHTTLNNLQMSPNMQTVYISDMKMNIVAVHFWGGIVKFGYDKAIEVGKMLACCNLQHRPRSSRKRFRNLYATEYSTFSQCPRKKHMHEQFKTFENSLNVLNLNDILEECRKCLVELANNNSSTNSFSNVNLSATNNNSYYSSRTVSVDYSIRLKRKLELNENSISGLDFDSSFNEPTSRIESLQNNQSSNYQTDKEMFSLLNTTPSDVDQRIKKLRMYEEPPPLSPIVINVSKTLHKEFITPKKSDGDKYCTKDEDKKPSTDIVSVSDSKVITGDDCGDKDEKKLDVKCEEEGEIESDPFKENFIYSPPDLE